ncbi:MAG: DEAD/DEAH box helicase, partial [Bacteroides sp.]
RLLSHLKLGYVDLSQVQHFILDEADRMLDMGFYEDIMDIVKHLPKQRQTIMFSATMPKKIHKLASEILNNPVEIKLSVSKPAENIVQAAYICYEDQKLALIHDLFSKDTITKSIIFASTKSKVKEVARALKKMNLNVGEMHSDLEQKSRERILQDFKADNVDILVGTDIISRGIDVDDIGLVINYDVPNDSEDYVHRIGRTARANSDGVAITFVNTKDQSDFYQIEEFLGQTIYKMPIPSSFGEVPEYTPNAKRRSSSRGGSKSYRGKRNHKKSKR